MVGHKKKDGKRFQIVSQRKISFMKHLHWIDLKKFDKSRVAAGRPAFFDDRKKTTKSLKLRKRDMHQLSGGHLILLRDTPEKLRDKKT